MNDLAETNGVTNPLVLLKSAIDKGIEPQKLGELMSLAERWEKNRAADKFAQSLTNFQAECPTVFKRRETGGDAKFKYAFASYDDIMAEAKPLLSLHGIVVTFSTDPAGEKGIKITCHIRVGTHVEDTTLTVPIPAMSVNDTQRFGAALSYAKRYAFCAALNIVVTDEDDDGARLMDTLTPEEVSQINALLKEKAADTKRFLEWAEADSVEDILREKFAKAVDMLRRKPSKEAAK